MPFIAWNDEMKVNIAEIDAQHQQLVSMINQLHEEMKQGKAKTILGSVLENMIAYAGTHFQTEEKYFRQFYYPETGVHVLEHQSFVKKVSQFKKEYDEGKQALSLQVMEFLAGWLKNHILNSDKRYGPFLNSKGMR